MSTPKPPPGSLDRKMSAEEVRKDCELILGWLLVLREESRSGIISNNDFTRIAVLGMKRMGKGDLEMAVMTMATIAEGMLNYMTSRDDLSEVLGESPRSVYTAAMLDNQTLRHMLEDDDDD